MNGIRGLWWAMFCCAVLCRGAALQGADVLYDNRAAFEAAVGGSVRTFDFEVASGSPAAPADISAFDAGRVEVMSTWGLREILVPANLRIYPKGTPNQALTGKSETDDIASERLFVRFNPPVRGFAFDILDLTPFDKAVTIGGFDTEQARSYTVMDNDGDPATPVFFGVTSDRPIAHISIVAFDPRIVPPGLLPLPSALDNFAVPEPAWVGLWTMALSAAALRRRRS